MAARRRLLRCLLGVHRICLHDYPSWFRAAHGEAMIATFEDLITGSYRRAGAVGATRVATAEYGSLLFRGMRERFSRPSPSLDGRPPSNGRRQHEINFRERNGMYAIGNLQHTLRSLARTPGYTAAFVLTLGLGIGANTAIFSVINGVLLRPLPYPDADRIMYLQQVATGGEHRHLPPGHVMPLTVSAPSPTDRTMRDSCASRRAEASAPRFRAAGAGR